MNFSQLLSKSGCWWWPEKHLSIIVKSGKNGNWSWRLLDGFGGCNGAVKKNLEGSAALLWSSMVGPTAAYAVRSASQPASLAAIYIVISTSTPTLFLLTTPFRCSMLTLKSTSILAKRSRKGFGVWNIYSAAFHPSWLPSRHKEDQYYSQTVLFDRKSLIPTRSIFCYWHGIFTACWRLHLTYEFVRYDFKKSWLNS